MKLVSIRIFVFFLQTKAALYLHQHPTQYTDPKYLHTFLRGVKIDTCQATLGVLCSKIGVLTLQPTAP